MKNVFLNTINNKYTYLEREREKKHNFDRLCHVENTSNDYLTKFFFAIEYDSFVFLYLSSICLFSLFCILAKKDT